MLNSLKTISSIKLKTAGISLLAPGLIMLFLGLNQHPPTINNGLHYTVIIGLVFQVAGVLLLGIYYFKTDKRQLYTRLFIAVLMLALVTGYFIFR
ncbi:MAG: hypothetical protein LPK03_11165 [Pontibacter sp.]|nr:hypothetical protein [Pontibacter sp.]